MVTSINPQSLMLADVSAYQHYLEEYAPKCIHSEPRYNDSWNSINLHGIHLRLSFHVFLDDFYFLQFFSKLLRRARNSFKVPETW